MIVEAMALRLRQLNDYIAQADRSAGAPAQAVWGNIAQLDRTEVATELENHFVLSLVNLEEERALKNGTTATTLGAGNVEYLNRPYHLNVFLLPWATAGVCGYVPLTAGIWRSGRRSSRSLTVKSRGRRRL